MEIGFETIGNATLVVHDRGPVLVTDPWIRGSAYFGSWGLSHEVPPEQAEAISLAPFAWISHGHPDHLNADSLTTLRNKTILLADHVGGRIQRDLVEQGFHVEVLRDREWRALSDHVRVLTVADYNQDSILLVDIDGTLVVDLNDAGDCGWGRFVRQTARGFRRSYLLALSGYGDADMIHFRDEDGALVPPVAARRDPVGPQIGRLLDTLGLQAFVPFSSMHRYQRADSVWANAYTTGLEDYARGFPHETHELLPAFVRVHARSGVATEIRPRAVDRRVLPPAAFGDDWNEILEHREALALERYFRRIEHLATFLDFVQFRVGGREHTISFGRGGKDRGITFDVPRASLVTAIRHEVFDDLLIGNFMSTTLHGRWPDGGLLPDFTPYVTKYADNGQARTRDEVARYFEEYRKRAPLDHVRHALERGSKAAFRSWVPADSGAYRLAKRAYWHVKRAALG